MFEEIYTLTLLLFFTVVTSLIDKETLETTFIYDHLSRFIQRCLFIVAISISKDSYWIHLLSYSLIFAATFDKALNLWRGLPFWHLGKTAKWDKFWRKNIALYKVFTFISLILSLYLIFLHEG